MRPRPRLASRKGDRAPNRQHMHRRNIITNRADAIRAEAILQAGIGIVLLDVTDDPPRIVDTNDAFGILAGFDVEFLAGAGFDILHGPRTDEERTTAMTAAARAGSRWKDTNVLQDSRGVPLPVQIDLSPKTWPDVEGQFAIAVITDAAQLIRAARSQRLLNDITLIASQSGSIHEQALGIAEAMSRDFADWCIFHLRAPDGSLRPEVVSSRHGAKPRAKDEADPGNYGIGKVIASGLPLLHQPSHQTTPVLQRQVEAIIGEPVHAVATVPIAATTLETFGAISWVITADKREYTHEEVQVAEEAASKFGHYIEETQIRDSLARAVRAREGFMKAAGHELRTPLVSIKGYTQLLLRDLRRQTMSPERLQAGLQAIDTSTTRLTDLMEDLFAVTNPGPNTIPLRLATLDINQEIREFLATTPSLGLANHTFRFDTSEDALLVPLDITRFAQVLFNVVTNAVHYSPPNSAITIATSRENGSAVISVTDAGKGLAPGEESTIFDPFNQARNLDDSEDQGLGIGLFISRQIVERHGGMIWAESTGRNRGTTISIRLPRAENDNR
jgi:signal transduction histidine kinase